MKRGEGKKTKARKTGDKLGLEKQTSKVKVGKDVLVCVFNLTKYLLIDCR